MPNEMLSALFLPAMLIVVFYFIIIRPQKRREKETRAMHAALEVGNEVVTIGGVVGKISAIKEDIVTVEVGADRVKIQFERSAIRNVRSD